MRAGLSWMPEPRFRTGFAQHWERGAVGALELTLEHVFREPGAEDLALIEQASEAGWLLGHGVHYSVGSDRWGPLEQDWIRRVRGLADRWRFRWVTEHFGVLRAGSVSAAPVPLPFTGIALERGRERLGRLADAVGVPVGLENLALAWSADDARRQADFVEALLEPVDGLMVLDLHNLWCQAVNYGLDPVTVLEWQPLGRVRQVHVAGGSWSWWPEGRFRRDTHDGPVPGAVWELLEAAVGRCPGLEVVTLERLGPAIAADPVGWRSEVERLVDAVDGEPGGVAVPGVERSVPGAGDPAPALARLFEGGPAEPEAMRRAAAPWLDEADPRALRTAAALLERYGRRVP